MTFEQAKIIMMSGLPVKRAEWNNAVAAGRDRTVPSGVVFKRAGEVWVPTAEDLAATDWTLAVGV